MKLKTGARVVNPMINDVMRKTIAEVERSQKVRKVILDTSEEGHSRLTEEINYIRSVRYIWENYTNE